jgi:hypothetical protein
MKFSMPEKELILSKANAIESKKLTHDEAKHKLTDIISPKSKQGSIFISIFFYNSFTILTQILKEIENIKE